MGQEYTNYSKAQDAAKELSIKNPGIGHYVSHVDMLNGYPVWCVGIFEDYPGQDYWLNGVKYYPDDEDNFDDEIV